MATTIPQAVASTSNASSPPPNCAICLGNCINKCFTDSCMHHFCFQCLLEWSKVKAVCPLCKQPFNKIMHNVKLDNTYDEHYIERETNRADDDHSFLLRIPESSNYDFILPTTTSRLFQLITSLAVDPRGEFAFQQLLSAQPLTNNQSFYDYIPPGYENFSRFRRRLRERDVSSSSFRRSIYNLDLWVSAAPDAVDRYRDISPIYFRENPTARNRLVPWLNRELNVLLHENTPHVMYVVDTILLKLNEHHIRSQYFRQLLEEFFGAKTDHFIHEFYNYMKSPYDMIGYDRHVSYITGRPPQFLLRLSDEEVESSDSDVAIVSVTPAERVINPVVIEIESDTSRDSDVIYQEPPPPVIVDLVNSDSSETVEVEQTHHKPILPLKIRLKHKRQCRERKSKRKLKDSSSDSESSDSSSNKSSDYSHKKYKRKRKYKKTKYYIVKQNENESDHNKQAESESDSKDDEPILSRLQKCKGQLKTLSKTWNQKYYPKQPNDASTSSTDNSSNKIKHEIEGNESTEISDTESEHKQDNTDTECGKDVDPILSRLEKCQGVIKKLSKQCKKKRDQRYLKLGNESSSSSTENSIKHENGSSNIINSEIEKREINLNTYTPAFLSQPSAENDHLFYPYNLHDYKDFAGSSRMPANNILNDIYTTPGPSGIHQMEEYTDCFPASGRYMMHTTYSDDSSSGVE